MRNLLLSLLVTAIPVWAQEPATPGGDTCNVVTGSPDVNAAGEFVRPTPTAEECELAGSLEGKFLATPRGDFRLVRSLSRLPEPVRLFIEGIGGETRIPNPVDVQVGRYPSSQRLDLAVWLSTELVVIAYRISDMSGSSTNITLADIDSLTSCEYVRWRGGELPGSLTIAEIQRGLDKGLLGDRETPACHLGHLPLD